MTNGDRIRISTDEELAKRELGRIICDGDRCKSYGGDCYECSLDWLKEEAEDSEPKSPEFLSGYSHCLNELTEFLNKRKPDGR